MTTVVLVQQGGTGSNNATDARSALGAAPSAAYDVANSAYTQANAAYAAANTGGSSAADAYNQANAAYAQANTARSDANTTFSTINTTFGTVNTNIGNAYSQANLAYAAANNSNLKLGGLVSGTLNVTQDLIVGGNIYLEGNTTYINVSTYSVEDSLIYLASNNKLTDSVDIGFMGGKNTGGTYSHTGLARDATDGKWKLFDGLPEEGHVGNVVNFANTYLATLVANVEANNITVLGNKVAVNTEVDAAYSQANTARNTANSAYGQANAAYGQANSAFTAANNRVLKSGDTMTGALTLGAGRTVGSGGIVLSQTGLNTDIVANGRTSGISTGWGTFRIHQEAGNPGLIIAGESGQTGAYVRIQNSSESPLVIINSSGYLSVGGSDSSGSITSIRNFGNSAAINFAARATGSAQGQLAGYSFYPTFQGTGDNGPRRAADILAGFNGGAWGTQYLAFGVGSVGDNDAQNLTVERMRITTSGEVNIGSPTNYGGLLSVNRAQSASVADLLTLRDASAGTTFNFQTYGDPTYGTANRLTYNGVYFVIRNNTTEQFRIDSSGNIGIGTFPGQYNSKFIIQNSGNTSLMLWNSGVGSGHIGLAAASPNFKIYNTYATGLLASGNGIDIDQNGNVGIGTSSPGQRLEVYAGDGGPLIRISSSATGTGTNNGFHLGLDGSGGAYVVQNENQPIYISTNNTVRGAFTAAGGFSIGTTANPGAGAIYATGDITAFYSDDRLKTKLGNIDNALSKVLSLNGFYFEPNQTAMNLGYENKKQVGVSAQEVKAVLPEVVVPAPIDQEYMTVHYHKIVPLLIEAIKELNDKIDKLTK